MKNRSLHSTNNIILLFEMAKSACSPFCYVLHYLFVLSYSPRRSRGEYSPIITEPEANNCFSTFAQVFLCFSGLNSF